jgi:predicted nucleic acid-binding protein
MIALAVVDTNVVVSGVLARDGDSPTGRILDAMLIGDLHIVLSEELLAEYRAVLLRPAIVDRHGLSEAEVDVVLEGVVVNAVLACVRAGDHARRCSHSRASAG